jgi:hypothetical protein
LTSPTDHGTGVINLFDPSGGFGEAQAGFEGLNDGFASPSGEIGSGSGTANEFGNAQDGFGGPVGGIVDAKGPVHGDVTIESTGQGHAHGHEVHHNNAENVVQNSIGQNSITDALGNAPPPPTGTHVDLPGEHGNPHDFPVIHHGEVPIQDLHPNSIAAKMNNLPGHDHSVPVPMESSHGPHTVSHGPANVDHSSNPFHATNVHNLAGRPISKGGNFEDLTSLQNNGDGFMDFGVQQPILTVDGLLNLPHDSSITANHASDQHHSMHSNIDSSASKTDGFVSKSDGFFSPESVGHVDTTQQSFDKIPSDLPGHHQTPIDGAPVVGNTHIDMPGQHGVPIHGEPVVHREGSIMQPEQGVPVVDVHVDMPGEHNNPQDGGSVIHREIHHGSGQHPADRNTLDLNTALHGPSIDGVPKVQHIDHSGIHIDEPGVHGNMLNEPALHLPPGATVQDAIAAGIIPDPSLPEAFEHQTGTLPGASDIEPLSNVHVDLPGEHGNPMSGQAVVHRENAGGLGHQNEGLNIKNAGIGVNVDSVHVDLPGQHDNPLDGTPVIHREGQQNIGNRGFGNKPATLSSGASIFGDVHVDLPGEHGNVGEHPVIHRDSLHTGHQDIAPMDNVHVDLPGQHDNPANGFPTIHRETTHIGTQERAPIGNVHVDLPGQHGNPIDGQPVIHREATHIGPQADIPLGNVHIDLPGQHGIPANGMPTIHREVMPMESQGGAPMGNVHIDLPGQHGVPANDMPTIHREATPIVPPVGTPVGNMHIGSQGGAQMGNVHIDLPGQHGIPANGIPTIHREATPIVPPVGTPMGNMHIGSQGGAQMGNVHIDLPGQHGIPANGIPTIHREATPMVPQVGTPMGNVHIDLPGQHGIPANGLPTIHREVTPFGPQVGDVHVDLPGQHGIPPNGIPTIHRGATDIGIQVGTPIGNVHVDMPGNHGNPIHGIPTVHREPEIPIGLGKPSHPKHSGIHIDAPGEHGNQLNEPALHLPPGATIEDAIAAGVIPGPEQFDHSISKGIVPGMSPVVPTGVLPGTKNVPVPKRVGKELTNHGIFPKPNSLHIPGSSKEKSLGDMLGLPTVHLGINDYDRTKVGVIDDNSVLLKKGGRRRNGRHGKRRRQGRKWHPLTTTTPAPKKSSGGGITIIRKTNPNPLAVLGDALRSAFNNRNSGGGGLLGTLMRSVVNAQQGPRILPPGGVIMRPIRIQPIGGQLFGRLFG